MITIVLLAVTLLFIAYASLKGSIEKAFKIKICALCAAVMTTWIGMLVLKFAGTMVENTIIAVLIGESIAGMMYNMNGRQKINPVAGLPLILFGTWIAYSIIELKLNASALLVLVPVILIMAIISASSKKLSGKGKSLMNKLENCCG